ncbi:Cuticular protein RR2 family member 4, partial [Caligus rogercresseyi]
AFLLIASAISLVQGGTSTGFLRAPIRISDLSGLRSWPLATPLHFDTFPRRPTVLRQSLSEPSLISLVRHRPQTIDPAYNFGYSVSDSLTGDTKTREETRTGDVVRGSYSVADPDGRIRTVTYTADAENGFQAKVTYDGKEGPVSIPQKPSLGSLGGNKESKFDDDDEDDVVIVEGRNGRKPIRSETFSLLHPVSLPSSSRGALRGFTSLRGRPTAFITPDGRIISASLK